MMRPEDRDVLMVYLGMIRRFIAGEVRARDFAPGFQRRVQDDGHVFGAHSRAFAVVDAFWMDCEEFVEDPALRRPGDFDEVELLARAQRARREIEALLAEG
ncbi:colicin immunity domain-containing protein [Falsiroseomonas oryzae]|uniref:colicin immunity domain-containing protein n=1 Tax=Falsiroseomonas oryzae TaxID=2766473 RepID=UPI0022EB4BE1|nr:colicin immunity domain-containing protein [Roseomonas sp. MO-31]